MARPNRNNKSGNMTIIEESAYRTAIYARLSVEDNGVESDSIENQIYMLEKYVCQNKALTLVSTHLDNGMTGTNFDRPGFIAMLDEVKKREINCIVVKDLSRFGRNYIETGNYLEKIFPYLGVRFISVNDNYDSIDATANEVLSMSLKNVYHHIYAKDISRKICTSFDVKKKKGFFLGKFAPYGYKKSTINHHLLEIDEQTSPIIRDIFKLRVDGLGVFAIAKILNEKGIPSQYRMLYEQGLLKGSNGEAKALWSGSSVLSVLQNPNYYGCIVERKSDGAYYKGGKTRIIPKSEWNYIENTHEAIIDKITFDTVQELIEESKLKILNKKSLYKNRVRSDNLLQGLVICGSCKRKMSRDSGYYDSNGNLISHRYVCAKKYIKGGICTAASIKEDNLIESIFSAVKMQIALLADMQAIVSDYLQSSAFYMEKNGLLDEVKECEGNILQLNRKIIALHKDFKQGLLSENSYIYAQKKYEMQQEKLQKQMSELKNKQTVVTEIVEPDTDWLKEILAFRSEKSLNREMCLKLISGVEVFDGHIKINYTFNSELDKTQAFISTYAKVGVKL